MAFFMAPRFAPAHAQQYNPWSCPSARPSNRSISRVSRPSISTFIPFLSQVDGLLSELDREARQQAYQQQQRKRIVSAYFNVHERDGVYQLDGEIPGFEQDNLDIEVTDENTLRIVGNTERVDQAQSEAAESLAAKTIETEAQNDATGGVTLIEPEETTTAAATPSHSDTESHRSYHATVEDDFEDLGAETIPTLSTGSAEPKEPKGDEQVDEQSATIDNAKVPQPQTPTTKQQSHRTENRFHGFFERTFRFPERIDASHVKASLKNGLLSVTVPKAKAPEVKRIVIQ